jgi:chorismate mutase
MTLMVRGVRGATTVADNDSEQILLSAEALLREMIAENGIEEAQVASVFFTTTPDLTAAYPAGAARRVGWRLTALMGMVEMDNPEGLKRCIRILIHWNTEKKLDELNHIYLNDAASLRPDFVKANNKTSLEKETTS